MKHTFDLLTENVIELAGVKKNGIGSCGRG